ncbi:hypothetical protein NIBR502774_17815 (plasmid) [Rhizobium sp. NIBRBAC000502774]|nr:hypothetical protein NIBR502774_17815 [Rhizobium sp. NIBRBAC000502774]
MSRFELSDQPIKNTNFLERLKFFNISALTANGVVHADQSVVFNEQYGLAPDFFITALQINFLIIPDDGISACQRYRKQ